MNLMKKHLNYKKKTNKVYSLFLLCFVAFLFLNYNNAPPAGYTGAPGESTCTACHGISGNNNLDGDIEISGIPASIQPNTTYPLTITVSNPNGISLKAGFQMIALDENNQNVGVLDNESAGSRIRSLNNGKKYFEHFPAQSYDANRTTSWTVDWTAPANGNEVTFYAAGNITDGNSSNNTSGDFIVTTNLTTTLNTSPSFSDLSISNLTNWGGTAAQGEEVFFNFDLNNTGDSVAEGEFLIEMYLSTDTNFSSNDTWAGEVPTGNIPVGTISDIPGGITVPETLSTGNYFLLIVADPNNDIEELNESNNVLASADRLTVISTLSIAANTTNPSCPEVSDGSININVNGGISPYTYTWSVPNIANGNTANGLSAGTYSVTVTDDSGSTAITSATLTDPPTINVESIDVQAISCFGENDGAIQITLSGGNGTFSINPPLENLASGTYSPTVTSGICSIVLPPITVSQPSAPLSVNIVEINQPQCNGDKGNVQITANGGTPPYNIATSDFVNLDPGNYTATITDAQACEASISFSIEAPELLSISIIEITPASCFGDPTSVELVVSGGTPPYSGFESGTYVFNEAGIYSFITSDNNGCSANANVTIDVPDALDVEIVNTTVDTGTSTGTADISVSGGTPPYQYAWTFNNELVSTQEDPTDLAAGIYNVNILDANNCFLTTSVTIEGLTNTLSSAFEQHINLFPNPTNGLATLDMALPTNEWVSIKLMDYTGKVINIYEPRLVQDQQFQLDLSDYSNGLYIVQIIVDDELIIKQLVK